MTHYEVLGITPSASSEDVRHAYLDLARRYHPDRAVGQGADPATVREDDDRMRQINAAWATLRDADRRHRYDLELARSEPGAGSHPPRPENATSPDWAPLVDDDTDYAALLDDTPVEGTTVPRWLQVTPAFLFLAALVAIVVGLVISVPPLWSLGLVALVVSVVLFLAVPLFAVFASRQHDPDR